MVRISRSWLHGKSKRPKQKELENSNLEEILGENILSNEFSIPHHPTSGEPGEALTKPERSRGDIQVKDETPDLALCPWRRLTPNV